MTVGRCANAPTGGLSRHHLKLPMPPCDCGNQDGVSFNVYRLAALEGKAEAS